MCPTPESTLTSEERLQALLYQYLALYERWSEDRQIAAKRAADHADMVKQFSTQVQAFKALAPQVEQKLIEQVHSALASAINEASQPLQSRVQEKLDRLVKELDRVVYKTQDTLSAYTASHAQEVKRSQWKVIGITVGVCLLLSGLAIQRVTSTSLTSQELEWMYSGQLMNKVYPRLSSAEQEHWEKAAAQVMREERAQ